MRCRARARNWPGLTALSLVGLATFGVFRLFQLEAEDIKAVVDAEMIDGSPKFTFMRGRRFPRKHRGGEIDRLETELGQARAQITALKSNALQSFWASFLTGREVLQQGIVDAIAALVCDSIAADGCRTCTQNSGLKCASLLQPSQLHNCPHLCHFAAFATATDTCGVRERNAYKTDPAWQNYEFNDLFRHPNAVFQKNRKVGPPQSLINEYYATAGGKGDLDTLCTLTRKRALRDSHPERFYRASLILHLRVGDVVDDSVYSLGTMLKQPTCFYTHNLTKCGSEVWDQYVKPLAAFQSLPEKIDKEPEHVIIMIGSHQGSGMPTVDDPGPRSCWYTHAVKAYLQTLWPRTNITIRTGNSPDDDIVLASLARAIITSGGGFTGLLGDLCSHCSGGTVYSL